MKILLTGVSRGIGKAIAELALDQGHEVIGISRGELASNHELMEKKTRFTHLIADLTKASEIKSLETKLRGIASHLDVLINNAGVAYDRELSFDETTQDHFLKTFQVNLIAVHMMTQMTKGLLSKSEAPKVFNISSVMGSVADNTSGKYYAYRSSKAALNAWNKSFSIDHPKFTSVVIHPGWVATDMGGPQAPLDPKKSAAGILDLVTRLGIEATGKFYDYKGREVPW